MTAEQDLTAFTRPRDVVAAAGDWLGAALAPSGFGWLPRPRRLQRRVGTLVHQVHLQPGRHNRAGGPITVTTMLNVREPALREWRRANDHRVVPPIDDFVCGHLLGYASGRTGGYRYGSPEDGDIDLSDPVTRRQRLEAFAVMFRQAVLPWFDEASDPDLVVDSRAGDYTNSPRALVEWLASRNRPDLVDEYVRRYLARTPGARPRFQAGVRAGSAPSPTGRPSGSPPGDQAGMLGWSVARLTDP